MIIIIIAIIIGRGGAAVLMFSEGRLTLPHFENPCPTPYHMWQAKTSQQMYYPGLLSAT